MAIVYTGGTFDLLHAGHIDFLKVCKQIAGKDGKVIVALNTDEFIKEFKGKPPVCSYEERKRCLEACVYVDMIIENIGDADSKVTIESLANTPDFIVIGDDWAVKDYYKQMDFTREWLMQKSITLLYVARQRDLSSTQIKERTNGHLAANTLPKE